MPRRVLDVGQCGPDHATIRAYLTQHFDCLVARAHGPADAFDQLQAERFDLVLVNRKLDRDQSDGLDIIRRMKSDRLLAEVPVMLVTNYAEHQDSAVAAGAIRGFGKQEFDAAATRERLAAVLIRGAASTPQPPL
jgi:CheY-like chemotaxis protein